MPAQRHWTLDAPRWSPRLHAYYDGENRGLAGDRPPYHEPDAPLVCELPSCPRATAKPEIHAAYHEGWDVGDRQRSHRQEQEWEYYGERGERP
jgi:hypothetical protein